MSDSKKLPTTVGEIIAEEMNCLNFEETVTFNLGSLLRRHTAVQTEKHKDEFSPFNTVNS